MTTTDLLTSRELEIMDEHMRDWTADNDGQTLGHDEIVENLIERIRETEDDEPALAAEFRAILVKLDR